MSETVTIEKLISGGMGLARTGKGFVFVADVCAGETVEIEIIGMKAKTPFGRPLSIIAPSPFRKKPPCPYYKTCGGCDWQHIGYEAQAMYKKDIFIDCLQRIGKLPGLPPIELMTGPEWAYRRRTQFKIDPAGRSIGFYRRKTNEVTRIDRCMLLVDKLNTLLKHQDALLSLMPQGTGQVKAVAGSVDAVASEPVIKGWTCRETEIVAAGKSFHVGGDDFFQGNAFLIERLGAWVSACVDGGRCADIYGGLGFFSILCAHRFSSAVLVDHDERLVRRAGENIRRNSVGNVSTLASTAERFFEYHQVRLPPLDCVIIDPPRPGLSAQVRKGLLSAHPRIIIYVSCNPSTQARDVGFLAARGGYTVEKAAVFDLYPQTHHVETAVVLKSR